MASKERGNYTRLLEEIEKRTQQLSKGMRANLDREIKRRTSKVLRDIKWLDDKTEAMELDEDGWRLRYELERELEEIYTYKESI
jgi:seryl-tRNA synthetase